MSVRNLAMLRERIEALAELRDSAERDAQMLHAMADDADALGWSQVAGRIQVAGYRADGYAAGLTAVLRRMKRGAS